MIKYPKKTMHKGTLTKRNFHTQVVRDEMGKKQYDFKKGWYGRAKNISNGKAMATGNGLWVLDIDTKDFKTLPKQLRKFLKKLTPTVETANGYHYYFTGPGIPQTQKLIDDVDTRNEGGFVNTEYWGDDDRTWYKRTGEAMVPSQGLISYLNGLSIQAVKRKVDTLKTNYTPGEPWAEFADGEQHDMIVATIAKMRMEGASAKEIETRYTEYIETYLSDRPRRHENNLMNGAVGWAMKNIEVKLSARGTKLKELPPPKGDQESEAIDVEVIGDIGVMIADGEDMHQIVAEIAQLASSAEREKHLKALASRENISIVSLRDDVAELMKNGGSFTPAFADYSVGPGGELQYLNTKLNMKQLLKKINIKGGYDVILKEILVKGVDKKEENWKDVLRSHVISEAMKHGIPRIAVEDHLAVSMRGKNKNPLLDSVKGIKWDGKNHIKKLAKRMKVADGTEAYRDVILKRWLIQCVASWDAGASTPRKDALPKYEYVFVLGGDQGVNKTTLFTKLMGGARRRYFDSGAILKPSDRDSVKQNTSFGMVELGELDATTRKSDIAEIKAFMSNEHDVYRVPYGREDERHKRRTAYCASVNPIHFLVDSTGSRRFLYIRLNEVMELSGINFDQVWAQAWSEYQGGERWWIERSDPEYGAQQDANAHATDDRTRTRTQPMMVSLVMWCVSCTT